MELLPSSSLIGRNGGFASVFDDVAGVRWQEIGSHGPNERDDSTYEIVDSEWVRLSLEDGGVREPSEVLRHFKLCFNAYGPLEVLAASMSVE